MIGKRLGYMITGKRVSRCVGKIPVGDNTAHKQLVQDDKNEGKVFHVYFCFAIT
jgi:hypothetical protein